MRNKINDIVNNEGKSLCFTGDGIIGTTSGSFSTSGLGLLNGLRPGLKSDNIESDENNNSRFTHNLKNYVSSASARPIN